MTKMPFSIILGLNKISGVKRSFLISRRNSIFMKDSDNSKVDHANNNVVQKIYHDFLNFQCPTWSLIND